MPLEDAINLVTETQRGMIGTGESLEESKKARDRLNRELSNARDRLRTKREGTKYPETLVRETIKQMKSTQNIFLLEIMIEKLDEAIETSDEFGFDVYKSSLYEVAADRDIYHLVPIGTGWNTHLFVNIVFAAAAGSLTDWARGITAYREYLGTDTDAGDGEKATNIFVAKVFGKPLYTKTLRNRLAYSTRKAPFWEILNSGSQTLLSDRDDGSYNPFPQEPTNFIGEAEGAIQVAFNEIMTRERERWFEEASVLQKEIEMAAEIRDGFTEDIKKLRVDVKLNTAVLASLGKRAEYVDENKLAEAIRKTRAGQEFETATIDLSKEGGKRVSITPRVLARSIEGLLDY